MNFRGLIPNCIEVAQHKVTNKLLVFVAGGLLVVLEFDPADKFQSGEPKVIQNDKSNPISKMIYHADCGLIVSYFIGHVALFDNVQFKQKGFCDGRLDHKESKQ
jgi:hypothetical protein